MAVETAIEERLEDAPAYVEWGARVLHDCLEVLALLLLHTLLLVPPRVWEVAHFANIASCVRVRITPCNSVDNLVPCHRRPFEEKDRKTEQRNREHRWAHDWCRISNARFNASDPVLEIFVLFQWLTIEYSILQYTRILV